MAKKKRQRIYLTRQALPALFAVGFGIVMMVMPFVIEHGGYAGDIIVASSKLKPPFDQTLIYIDQDTVDESVGIILNKPLNAKQTAALTPFIRDSGVPVGYGGPIQVTEKIYVLEEKHTDPPENKLYFDINPWDDVIRDRPDLLDEIKASNAKGEHRFRLFTGYTSWGSFQLEREAFLRGKWRDITATHDRIFQNGPDTSWDALSGKDAQNAKPVGPQS